MGKKSGKATAAKRKKGASLEDMFGESAIPSTEGGWKTSAAMMAVDDAPAPAPAPAAGTGTASAAGEDFIMLEEQPPAAGKKKGKGRKAGSGKSQAGSAAASEMGCSEAGFSTAPSSKKSSKTRATSYVPGLGVISHSMKRGDRTTKQKKRKAKKMAKGVSVREKVGARGESKVQIKLAKTTLKHIW